MNERQAFDKLTDDYNKTDNYARDLIEDAKIHGSAEFSNASRGKITTLVYSSGDFSIKITPRGNMRRFLIMALEKMDQPLVFAFAITFTVIGMMALLGWVFASLHWTGPLGLVKGGVM